ncbi:bacteriocin [Chryseobacterium sp. M5]|uniref:bacteriocin-like protein n=1 Tax=Chryseobacterium sp. M5 TaxID=3379128 RepID=UPI0038578026
MKNFKKLSRNELQSVNGGTFVGPGIYACCIGYTCSGTVAVNTFDDLTCAPGTKLEKVGKVGLSEDVNP